MTSRVMVSRGESRTRSLAGIGLLGEHISRRSSGNERDIQLTFKPAEWLPRLKATLRGRRIHGRILGTSYGEPVDSLEESRMDAANFR